MQQCKGITTSGQRCKITRNLVDGYCAYHRDQAQQNVNTAENETPETEYPSNRNFSSEKTQGNGTHVHLLVFILALVAGIAIGLKWKKRG
jgi:hypothetical protein